MPIDFYQVQMSPPCRIVIMTAKAIGLELNMIECSPFKGDVMKPEFLAINPQHCIPTIVDGDLKLWESRVIATYLVTRYGKDDSLYPKDPVKRAEVDKMLYFDMGTIFQRFRDFAVPVVFGGEEKTDPAKLERYHEGVGFLNTFLEERNFAAGDEITVADLALVTNIVSAQAAGIDLSKHSNVIAWVDRCKKEMPYFEEAQAGLDDFGKFFKSKLNL